MKLGLFIGVFVALSALCGVASNARAQCCQHNELRASLVGLQNNKGRVGCIIFNSAEGFPRDRTKAVQQVRAPIHDGSGTREFKGLPPGTYGIAAFHDEYETGKMKTNFLGMPQEAYGFSNDAKPSALTPPPFNACAFTYSGGVMDIIMHAQQ
jgi:uncharacterized protein (DUF2141 family)